MTDRDRLEKIVRGAVREWTDGGGNVSKRVLDALLAAGVTLPPQPAAPVKPAEAVTSEEAARKYSDSFPCLGYADDILLQRRHALDAAMPLLARDHGYVKAGAASPASVASIPVAEVERRARGWWQGGRGGFPELIAALTRAEG